MVNKIIQGVAAALKSIGYPIYQDNVEQGLSSPCFFIATLAPSMVRNPGKVTRADRHRSNHHDHGQGRHYDRRHLKW